MAQFRAEEWLSLREASELLGVHPATLREWSDTGKLHAFRTPGGHRRFPRSEIERFLAASQGSVPQPATMVRAALAHTRAEIATAIRAQPWAGSFDDAERERKRRTGRQLMGLMVQYMSRRRPEASLLEEACELGREYGRDMAGAGHSLIDATLAFMFFRDSVLESIFQLPNTNGLDREESIEMFGRLSQFMNQVLRAMMEAHQAVLAEEKERVR
ncbi:MAG: DNA-binding protein [Herpetosiphonaceae bacterium]|nr:MAG: DNA-binding protein [Herpetosiphonaceae bacterium]